MNFYLNKLFGNVTHRQGSPKFIGELKTNGHDQRFFSFYSAGLAKTQLNQCSDERSHKF